MTTILLAQALKRGLPDTKDEKAMGLLGFFRRKPVATAPDPAPILKAPVIPNDVVPVPLAKPAAPAKQQPAIAPDGQPVSSAVAPAQSSFATWPVTKESVLTEEVAPVKEAPAKKEIPRTQSKIPVKTEPDVAPAEFNYATWVDPKVEPATGEWEHRLNSYARKCARQLTEAGVPLFQTVPCDGDGHYCDAFWLIACDVEWGEKAIVENPLTWIKGAEPYDKRDIRGWFYGRALLLTKSGVLCTAFLEAALNKKGGGVSDRALSGRFTEIERPIDRFRTWEWGWNNRGKWRRDPARDHSYHGLPVFTHGKCFEWWHDSRSVPDDGRGTSAALSAFVKSNGQVRWPRGFIND